VAEAAGLRQTEPIHLRPDYAAADAFFVTSHGNAGTGDTDDPDEQQRRIRYAATSGLNLLKTTDAWRLDRLRWPARYRRALGDLALLAGVTPSHQGCFKILSATPRQGGSPGVRDRAGREASRRGYGGVAGVARYRPPTPGRPCLPHRS
jgi:hypothetical protein